MFSRGSQGQKPADGSAEPSKVPRGPGGRHAMGAPRSGASHLRSAIAAGARVEAGDGVEHGKTTGRMRRFSDLQVGVKDGTVYDASGRMWAVGPLAGARAHVTVLEPDLAKANLVSRALGRKQVSMVIHFEITVTVAETVLTRARDANGAGTNQIRSAKKQAAEFNDLARHWRD